jgi:sulfate transport system permease protein
MAAAITRPQIVKSRKHQVLPGFGLSLGYSIFYLSVIVLIPITTLFLKSSQLGWHGFARVIGDPEAVAAFKLSFTASFGAALINLVFGFLIAWVLGRYDFPFRKLFDSIVDLPFALPTAVAGISLAAVYSSNGWIGKFLTPYNIKIAYTPLGVLVALVFVGLPYVVRTIQPVLEDLEEQLEEAAESLGANRWQTFIRVILPVLVPPTIAGFSLAFGRALGEYGSVIFISNNVPFKGEIVPSLIVNELYGNDDLPAATALAVVMLLISFALLLIINTLQRIASRYQEAN